MINLASSLSAALRLSAFLSEPGKTKASWQQLLLLRADAEILNRRTGRTAEPPSPLRTSPAPTAGRAVGGRRARSVAGRSSSCFTVPRRALLANSILEALKLPLGPGDATGRTQANC